MRSKTAIAIIARHELLATNRSAPRSAGRTRPARNDSGDNHRPSKPSGSVFSRGDNPPGNFMSEDKGQGMARRDTIECESYIRVADAAARNLHDDIVMPRVENREFANLQGCVGRRQLKSVPSIRMRHFEPRCLFS
jgi:hypothetical protein